jgi:hypothetical protein
MRKYCTGCGASLLKKVEDYESEPVEETDEEPIAGAPSYSEDDQHVLPSEVASEQVEMESEEPEPYEVIEETPIAEEVSIEPEEEEEEEEVPETQPIDYDRGKEVVKDILEKVKAAEARSRGEEVVAPSETHVEPPPEETFETIEEPLVYEEPVAEEEEVSVDELELLPLEEMPVEEPVPATSPPVYMTADEPTRDEKVRILESDISAFLIEREQLQLELNKLRTRLDEEVERYHTVAEVKRTRAESIERDLSLAKKEHSDASKEYKNADDRRKKELSNAEKRIHDVEKRIKKARDSKEKRIQDIEKERRKREEEARKD